MHYLNLQGGSKIPMKSKLKNFLCSAVFILFAFHEIAHGAMSPVSVNLIPPVQFPPSDFSVIAIRVSALWGHHRNVYGFDLGLVGNITDQSFAGLGASGVFNYTKGTTTALGLQIAGLVNYNENKTRVFGLQAASISNINSAETSVIGFQLALANWGPHTTVSGLQIGIYNKAKNIYGLQVGLINECTDLHGIQIGLVNFHTQGLFAVSPLINFGF